MSQTKVLYGLSALYMGDIAADGGLGTSLTPVLYTVATTPVLTTAAGTKTDFLIEESDSPYFSITPPGTQTLSFSLYGMSAAQLYRFFGGTLVVGSGSGNPDVWSAPDIFPTKEQSIVLVHTQGGHLEIVRASINATPNWKFQKNSIPQIDFVATVLQPTKAATPRLKFSEATYP